MCDTLAVRIIEGINAEHEAGVRKRFAAKRLKNIAQGFYEALGELRSETALKASPTRYAGAIRRGNIRFKVQRRFWLVSREYQPGGLSK
jgi:hypothetical protein